MGGVKTLKLYLKIFDQYYCLVINDSKLTNYFKKEYLLDKKSHKAIFQINIFKDIKNCHLTTDKLKIKLPLGMINEFFYKYVDFITMTIIAGQCLKRGIYFAHGSAYEKNGLGYAFLGPPGAGKSTIIKNIPKEKIYSNDTIILKIDKNKIFIEPSPFDKKHVIYKGKNNLLLDKVFILNKASFNKINNLSLKEIFQTLVGSDVYSYLFNMITKEKKLKLRLYWLALKIYKNTIISRLNFKKDFKPFQDIKPNLI